MYLWRKLIERRRLVRIEEFLEARSGQLAVIDRPQYQRVALEVSCRSATEARQLVRKFGGKIHKLPQDWLKRFARAQQTKPIKIGKRLVITNVGGTSVSRLRAEGKSRRKGPSHIVIPAGMAFGTGDHATTAMSLRLLEEVSRTMKSGWSLVDLGTGSGILALAAKRFGAERVRAIDNDPRAIATARENARLNKIDDVGFRVGDVGRWKFPRKIDIVTANLFSELLIEVLPKLKPARYVILSGVLRVQEEDLVRELGRCKIDITKVRRRSKWIAILANCSGAP